MRPRSSSSGAGSPVKDIRYFKPDDQDRIPVYMTPVQGLAGTVLPGFGSGFEDEYFAFYDNYLVSGNSFSTISKLLYDNILNKTLANDLAYRDFENTLTKQGRLFFLLCSFTYY